MTWDRTPLGLQTVPPCRPRAALAPGEAGKTQESSQFEGSGAAREAERDTTGSVSRQPPVHTWNDRPVQGTSKGKRRGGATVVLIRLFIHRNRVKWALTPWFYCRKRGRSEAQL